MRPRFNGNAWTWVEFTARIPGYFRVRFGEARNAELFSNGVYNAFRQACPVPGRPLAALWTLMRRVARAAPPTVPVPPPAAAALAAE